MTAGGPGPVRRAIQRRVHKIPALRNARAAQRKLITMAKDLPVWLRWRQRAARRPGVKREAVGPLHIALVSRVSKARLFKLAHAIRHCGHRVTLVSGARYSSHELEHFDGHRDVSDPWKILEVLEEMSPDVVHVIINYDNFVMSPVVRFSPAPVVLDSYDVQKGMMTKKWQADWVELRAERQLFETADHICARHLEPLVLKRRFGYRIPDATFFPDYCWRGPRTRAQRQSDGLSIVYCGNVLPEDRFSQDEAGYAQYIGVARALARQNIHFHLYPAWDWTPAPFDEFFALYIKENETNEHFHFYRTVPYGELIDRLGDYDAALHLFEGGSGRITKDKLNYSTANKLFDYIEAGLPVLIHPGSLQQSIVRRCGTAVTVESLQDVRPALEAALASRRPPVDRCDLEHHAPRLARMYEHVTCGAVRDTAGVK
jgi:hypothetical protein